MNKMHIDPDKASYIVDNGFSTIHRDSRGDAHSRKRYYSPRLTAHKIKFLNENWQGPRASETAQILFWYVGGQATLVAETDLPIDVYLGDEATIDGAGLREAWKAYAANTPSISWMFDDDNS